MYINNILMLYTIIYKWGLGIGDWGLGPIPNPQSPIPKIKGIKNTLNFILIIMLTRLLS